MAALPLIDITVDQIQPGSDTGAVIGALLAYHILPEGAFTQKQLQRAGNTSLAPLLSLAGYPEAGNLTIAKGAGDTVTFTGTQDSTATIIVPDIKASPAQSKRLGKNVIAHVVDNVLLPPADILASAAPLKAVNTITAR